MIISHEKINCIAMPETVLYATGGTNDVSDYKKQIVKNLYLSNIAEEFVAIQVDLEIPVVINTKGIRCIQGTE
jgi:hypothetical protein